MNYWAYIRQISDYLEIRWIRCSCVGNEGPDSYCDRCFGCGEILKQGAYKCPKM